MLQTLSNDVEIVGRHLEILKLTRNNEPIGIVHLSNTTGYPHHKVRYSLRILEDEGLIVPTQEGAETTDKVPDFLADIDTAVDVLQKRLEAVRFDGQ